jgi:hypothetical protein
MDSKRWLDELPADEREVLEAGIGAGAPAGAKEVVWSGVAAKLPALAAAGTVAAGGVTAVSLLKVFAVGLGLGSAVVAGAAGYRSIAGHATAPAAVVLSATPLQPDAPERSELVPAPGDAPAREVPVEARVAAPALPRAAVPEAPLAEHTVTAPLPQTPSVASFPSEPAPAPAGESAIVVESRRVAGARASLRAGDARAVLAELDALDSSFPRGLLVQEREGLRIEALLSLGETARARELARRFLARYPASPHAPAVERALR